MGPSNLTIEKMNCTGLQKKQARKRKVVLKEAEVSAGSCVEDPAGTT